VWAYWGGSLWAGYVAWADYFSEVLGVSIDRNYLDLAESCGYYWVLDDVCFASERPREISLDNRGRLHSADGMSISYPSGWGLWHWHGVRVPREVIERPIDPSRIASETNQEVRRVMIERLGWDNYIKAVGAQPVQHDRFGELYAIDDQPIVLVRNSTPEPDGTVKLYALQARPGVRTAHEAVASTFGLRAPAYAPVIET
jgi:hypothetical protein